MAKVDELSPEAWGATNIGDTENFRTGRPKQFIAHIRNPRVTIRKPANPNKNDGKYHYYTAVVLPFEMEDEDLNNFEQPLYLDQLSMAVPSKKKNSIPQEDLVKLMALAKGEESIEDKEIPAYEGPFVLTRGNTSGQPVSVGKKTAWDTFVSSLGKLGYDIKGLENSVLGLDNFYGEFSFVKQEDDPKKPVKEGEQKTSFDNLVCVEVLPEPGEKKKSAKKDTPAAAADDAPAEDDFDTEIATWCRDIAKGEKSGSITKSKLISTWTKSTASDISRKAKGLRWFANGDNYYMVPDCSWNEEEKTLTVDK